MAALCSSWQELSDELFEVWSCFSLTTEILVGGLAARFLPLLAALPCLRPLLHLAFLGKACLLSEEKRTPKSLAICYRNPP